MSLSVRITTPHPPAIKFKDFSAHVPLCSIPYLNASHGIVWCHHGRCCAHLGPLWGGKRGRPEPIPRPPEAGGLFRLSHICILLLPTPSHVHQSPAAHTRTAYPIPATDHPLIVSMRQGHSPQPILLSIHPTLNTYTWATKIGTERDLSNVLLHRICAKAYQQLRTIFMQGQKRCGLRHEHMRKQYKCGIHRKMQVAGFA